MTRHRIFTADKLREECGVFGIHGNDDAAAHTVLGLHALQHRGQEAAGIVSFDGRLFHSHRALGLVGDHFSSEAVIGALPGTPRSATCAIRPPARRSCATCSRCSPTSRSAAWRWSQRQPDQRLALRRQLVEQGCLFQSTSDTEVIIHLIARSRQPTVVERLVDALRQVEGAYALVALSAEACTAYATLGIRPLVLGDLDGAPILASETCALDIMGARFVRDIEPGEVVSATMSGIESFKPFAAASALCIFEYVYFARPDSAVEGQNVYEVRKRIGAELAREAPAPADIVVPVPDSGVPSAIGYAQAARSAVRARADPQSLRGAHFHRAVGPHPASRRPAQAQRQSFHRRGQARGPGRRLDRARHHLDQDRRHDPQCRRGRGAHARGEPADHPLLLLRRRHAGAQPVAGRPEQSRSHGPIIGVDSRIFLSTASIARWAARAATPCSRSSATPASAATTRPCSRTSAAAAAPISLADARGALSCAPRRPDRVDHRREPGLGAALAERFAAEGASLVLVARTAGALRGDRPGPPPGGRATLVPLDLAEGHAIDQLGGALAERFGRLDVLLGCAAELDPSRLSAISSRMLSSGS